MQRLFASNEMMQKESGELFERVSLLEEQMGNVVDRVLESEDGSRQAAVRSAEQIEDSFDKSQPQSESVSISIHQA